MIITNKYNLPQTIVNAVNRSNAKVEKRISVTDLIGSPLIRQLKLKHWDEIEVDASDMLWALLGSAVHYVLEKGAPADAVAEEKLEIESNSGYTIVGRTDLYHNGIITDWKITSVWSFLLGEKPEWERQLNVYGYLYMIRGIPVTGLEINAILRDHQKSKIYDSGYPKIPFHHVDIPLWAPTESYEYVMSRIRLHSQPADICTPEERWLRETTWAAKFKGKKRAFKVEKSLDDLHCYLSDKQINPNTVIIEERTGVDARCVGYCDVSKFCPYWNEKYKTVAPEQDVDNL